jgi:hypothetical protein
MWKMVRGNAASRVAISTRILDSVSGMDYALAIEMSWKPGWTCSVQTSASATVYIIKQFTKMERRNRNENFSEKTEGGNEKKEDCGGMAGTLQKRECGRGQKESDK